jgi:hypothetical protein
MREKMGEKDWKTEYWSNQVRVAKGHGSTPDAADEAAREQLQEKHILRRKKQNVMENTVLEST